MSTLRVNGKVHPLEPDPPASITPAQLPWLESPGRDRVPPHLWEEAFSGPLGDFLNRPGKSFRARLVEGTWNIVSGQELLPRELPLIVEWIHAGSLIVDDIQDGSTHRRGCETLHTRYGVPVALNTGNSLYFLPLALLERLGFAPEVELELYRRISHAMLQCHRGQALDLTAAIHALPQEQVPGVVSVISELKTASLMELAAVLGPLACMSDPVIVDAFACFGCQVGIALQMLNDLSDLTGRGDSQKRYEDIRQHRATWPWAWAATELTRGQYAELIVQAKLSRDRDEVSSLAARLLATTVAIGRRTVHQVLSEAIQTLHHRLGTTVDLSQLSAELDRLESSYA